MWFMFVVFAFNKLTWNMRGKLGDQFMKVTKKISSSSALQNWAGLGLFKKHFWSFKTGSIKSIFIGHFLDNNLESTAEDMVVLYIIRRGGNFDSLKNPIVILKQEIIIDRQSHNICLGIMFGVQFFALNLGHQQLLHRNMRSIQKIFVP